MDSTELVRYLDTLILTLCEIAKLDVHNYVIRQECQSVKNFSPVPSGC